MPKVWSIFCDCPELAVDVARDAERIGLSVEPSVLERPWEGAIEALEAGKLAALAVAASASAGIGTILNDNTDNVFREPVSTTSLFLPSRINTWSMSTARSIVSIRRWLTKSSSVGWQVTMRLA